MRNPGVRMTERTQRTEKFNRGFYVEWNPFLLKVLSALMLWGWEIKTQQGHKINTTGDFWNANLLDIYTNITEVGGPSIECGLVI